MKRRGESPRQARESEREALELRHTRRAPRSRKRRRSASEEHKGGAVWKSVRLRNPAQKSAGNFDFRGCSRISQLLRVFVAQKRANCPQQRATLAQKSVQNCTKTCNTCAWSAKIMILADFYAGYPRSEDVKIFIPPPFVLL